MHTNTILRLLLDEKKTIVEGAYFETKDEGDVFVIKARPSSRELHRCPHCGRQSPVYDRNKWRRRWRTLDFGVRRVYIEALAPRVKCVKHGVVVARVPWARHNSDYTTSFETFVTWMALHTTISDVAEMYRIKWDTVASITRRVQESLEKTLPNRFDGLEAIGIDETSYKKGHKYMTVIVNHETGHLIWAHKGHGKEVLKGFFEALTEEQRASIKYVTADGAGWIADCVRDYCKNAERCIDPFHVVMWATEALDEVRRAAIRETTRGSEDAAKKGDQNVL